MTKFVFLTPAYNCKPYIKKTLFSMFAQSYDNWRAVIIDDVSTDGTGEYVRALADQCGFGQRIDIVRREIKYGEVRNTVTETANFDDDEVVVRLDGGDWLTENDCLAILDQAYSSYDPSVCWTAQRWAYTNFNIFKELKLKAGQTVYQHPWVSSHLKTYRASALKKVNKQNFFDSDNNWIMIACDQAVFLPMLHLAIKEKKQLVFVPMICYHYNIDIDNPDLFTEDRSIRQKQSAEWIRERGYVE